MKIKKIEIGEAEALLARVKDSTLNQDDYELIKEFIDTLMLLDQAIAEKTSSIKRLLKLIFGHKTEKKKKPKTGGKKNKPKKKVKGHGKNGAGDYEGAKKIPVPHSTLQHCDPCPVCDDGKLYRQLPGVVVRIKGTPPLQATVFEQEKLRCNICGKIFTASLPSNAGSKKYDATASTMLAVLRYGSGLPLNRIAKLQTGMGVPLAPSTQWDVIEKMADKIHPAYTELVRQGAQGDVIHNDDTTMKIQELLAENQTNSDKSFRKGIFTTGILSINDDRQIALFFTGRKHAGENMAQMLAQREKDLALPVQMCDALAQNYSEEFETLLSHCLVHGRRNFVEIANNFPEQCQHVLKTLGKVYHNDVITSEQGMTPKQRLHFHQNNSGPIMEKLHYWLNEQIDDKKVEPNSSLGKAINYMLKHWQKLTLFLTVEKAPLDNNICERSLKMAILHRKNSLFYKTKHGAYIGDLFMSLIQTCALSKINPYLYLTTLQKNSSALFKNPDLWMPWNYEENLNPSDC